MHKLKLNQKILSSTTGSMNNHLVDLYLTTIKDAITQNGRTKVVLGEGHWGQCPDRGLDQVITCKKDIKSYFDKSMEYALKHFKEKHGTDVLERLKERKCILVVDHFNEKYLNVSFFDYAGKTESLKDGTYRTYKSNVGGYSLLTIKEGETRKDVFRNLEDAYKYFEKKVIEILK